MKDNEIKLLPLPHYPNVDVQWGYRVTYPSVVHFHNRWEIGVVTDGCARLSFGKKTARLAAQSVVLIPPEVVHRFEVPNASYTTFRVLYVSAFNTGAERAAGIEQIVTPIVIDDAKLASIVLKCHRLFGSSSSSLSAEILIRELLHCLESTIGNGSIARTPKGTGAPAANGNALGRARDFLHDRFMHNVTLDELSAQASLSKYHFIRSFKNAYGLPPHLYQIQLRVHQAMRLIRQGAKLQQVAFDVGFYDQAHFSRHFKRLTQVTPGCTMRQIDSTGDDDGIIVAAINYSAADRSDVLHRADDRKPPESIYHLESSVLFAEDDGVFAGEINEAVLDQHLVSFAGRAG